VRDAERERRSDRLAVHHEGCEDKIEASLPVNLML
jgi:hypothetical protein